MTNAIIRNEILMEELLNEEQLDTISGGNSIDRGKIISTIRDKGLGNYLEAGKDNEDILRNTCKKYDIGYNPRTFKYDEFKIDGTWRSSGWINDHQAETIAFLKKKMGIK